MTARADKLQALTAAAPPAKGARSRLSVVLWKDRTSWDAFVESCPEASSCHQWVWKEVIEETYGHRGFYLAAVRDGRIQGVLPLFWMKSRLFGRFLTSIPFFSYGGVLAGSLEAAEVLRARSIDLALELGARHIELRNGAEAECDGWHHLTPKVTMVVRTPATVDDYSRQLSSKVRQRVRFASKHGLRSEWSGVEGIDGLYRAFSTNMHHLGTPVYPRAWFENICRHLPGQTRILTIRDGNEVAAAGIVIRFRDGVELPWSGSLPESRQKQSVMYMFWALIEWAILEGYRWVDFGRCSRASGVHGFKQLWLCEERPLHWYYWTAPGVPVPELRPDNPRFRLAIQLWKRLPLTVANHLGPRIARSIP